MFALIATKINWHEFLGLKANIDSVIKWKHIIFDGKIKKNKSILEIKSITDIVSDVVLPRLLSISCIIELFHK